MEEDDGSLNGLSISNMGYNDYSALAETTAKRPTMTARTERGVKNAQHSYLLGVIEKVRPYGLRGGVKST